MPKVLPYRNGTTQLVTSSSPTSPAPFLFEILNAPSTPNCWELEKGAIVLGAGLAADVVINNSTVSRRHAQFAFTAEGIEVTDLGSRNGTFYLGQRVERITFDRDCVIQLGEVHIRIVKKTRNDTNSVDNIVRFGNVTGRSPSICSFIRNLGALSVSDVTVLIEGESGTGKEFLARAIHTYGSRAKGEFITVHCGALDRAAAAHVLLTSVGSSAQGAFDSARGGTLFLDEVGDLPLDAQPLLMRALDVGDPPSDVNVNTTRSARIIASTQRELKRAVSEGSLRQDLFHRLNVVKLEVPPLRERREDIVHLAYEFAADFGIRDLSVEIIDQLCRYSWPGNVRELRNILRGYAAIGILMPNQPTGVETGFAHLLRSALDLDRPYQEQKDQLVNQFIDVYLTELLRRTNGNQSEAARIAGLDRTYLNKMLARLKRTAPGSNTLRSKLPNKPEF